MTLADSEAVDLLYRHLGALPDPEFGVINLLPFAQESDEALAIKRRVCEAIVRVFDEAGFFQSSDRSATTIQRVSVKCSSCNTTLLAAPMDPSGNVVVSPSRTIGQMAQLNPECPHNALTLEDQRRRIEQTLDA